jgi:phage baseplate assembly protein W
MAKFRYKGFSTKFTGNKLYDIQLAKQDLLNHIMTKKGERVMAPEFGSIVWDYLFDPLTPAIEKIIQDDIMGIIREDVRFEPISVTLIEQANGFTLAINLLYIPEDLTDQLVVEFDRTISEAR